MTQFIAHCGLSGKFPENTHIAFNAAWASDCDGIELDIQVTKDDKVIVIHDPDTARTAGEHHVIKDSHWADLMHLNVGQGGKGGSDRFYEQIPLLRDVVERMPAEKTIQVEIKQQIDNMNAVIAELDELSDFRKDIHWQIISFDPDKITLAKQELAHLDCFLVMDADEPKLTYPIAFAVENYLTGLGMHYPLITENFANKMQENRLQIACWTVNDSNVVSSLINKGVGFITGDFADKLLQCN